MTEDEMGRKYRAYEGNKECMPMFRRKTLRKEIALALMGG
jgi:hypothetical protein